jgi:hypothetical protein
MNKEFVPYQQSLDMKELGFDEICIATYDEDEYFEFLDFEQSYYTIPSKLIQAPLYQQAFRWFREKYNISYSIDWMSRSSEFYNGYYVHFRGINDNKINQENFIVLNDELPSKGYKVYKTYEEAELACLKKLIEIVKNGK